MPFQSDVRHVDTDSLREQCIEAFLALLAEHITQDADAA